MNTLNHLQFILLLVICIALSSCPQRQTPTNHIPEFTSVALLNAVEDTEYVYNIVASDEDKDESLRIGAQALPEWLDLTDNGNGTALLRGTPSNADVGEHNIILRVTDSESESDKQSFTITVTNTNDAPLFTSVPITSAVKDSIYTYNIAAVDVDMGDTLSITAPQQPDWLILTDNGDGTAVLSGTPTNDDVGEYNVVLQVADEQSDVDEQSFSITIVLTNDPPVFTSIPVTSADEDSIYTYNITATDIDSEDTLSITTIQQPAWLVITDNDDGTAILTGTPSYQDIGEHQIVLRATDSAGEYTDQQFTLTVNNTDVPVYTYEVINTYPHDPEAFTQGLVYENGVLYEGTGKYGESSIRRVELETGLVEQIQELSSTYFGEGITIYEDRLIQLTWKSNVGFVYDIDSFEEINQFEYLTEGWGLTHDGRNLIMSDGTSTIYYLDPESFEVSHQINVSDDGNPIIRLNELEYINGEIFANIWQTDMIVRIDPQSGNVLSWIDLEGLLDTSGITGRVDVLNGIAYDKDNERFFVTGKLWPSLFEISLIKP